MTALFVHSPLTVGTTIGERNVRVRGTADEDLGFAQHAEWQVHVQDFMTADFSGR